MTKQRDLKGHFEAILGRELIGPEEGEFALRERIASYTTDIGSTTSREIGTTGDSTKGCDTADLLDVSAVSSTCVDGTIEFMLSEFFCDFSGGNHYLSFQYPVNFVATSRTMTPVFVTAQAAPTNDRKDVRISVATWDASGASAPNASFCWRCRVPYRILPREVID